MTALGVVSWVLAFALPAIFTWHIVSMYEASRRLANQEIQRLCEELKVVTERKNLYLERWGEALDVLTAVDRMARAETGEEQAMASQQLEEVLLEWRKKIEARTEEIEREARAP